MGSGGGGCFIRWRIWSFWVLLVVHAEKARVALFGAAGEGGGASMILASMAEVAGVPYGDRLGGSGRCSMVGKLGRSGWFGGAGLSRGCCRGGWQSRQGGSGSGWARLAGVAGVAV